MIGSVTNSMCSVNYNVIVIITAIVVVVGVTNIDKYEIKFPYNLNIYISKFFFE